MTGGQQLMKRIPRIKFPQRHPKSSGSVSQSQLQGGMSAANAPEVEQGFFLKSMVSASPGGKASLQPKRMPVSEEEMEAIMMGGCF